MAIDYGVAIGLNSNDLIMALLITQFVGFPATLLFGLLGARWGSRKSLLLAIGVYLLVTIWAYFMDSAFEFYMLAIVIGLVQGGIQSQSRALYAHLIPQEKASEFFGFYTKTIFENLF